MHISIVGRLGILLIALLTLVVGVRTSKALDYPKKPVTMIVAFAPGGVIDICARAINEAIKPYFPQPIIVVNKPGGGGGIGTAELIQSPPDGNIIALLTAAALTSVPQISRVPYKGPGDIEPVIGVVDGPQFFMVGANTPWKTMKEALDYAKANPGKIRVTTPGVGSLLHMLLEDMKLKTKVDITHVPMTGSGPAMTALLGGHVEATIMGGALALDQVKAGKVRNLASFTDKRVLQFPDIPTFRELGYDITSVSGFWFVGAPKGTPREIIATLQDAFNKSLKTDAFQKYARDNVYLVIPIGPDDLKKRLGNDYTFYKDLLTKVKLQ